MFEEYVPILAKGVAVGIVRGLKGFADHKKETSGKESFNLGKYVKSVIVAAGIGVAAELLVSVVPVGSDNAIVQAAIDMLAQYVAPWVGTDVVEDIFK